MARRRHVPLRTCVSCGLKVAKRELLRIVASPDGTVFVDDKGRQNGRGTYLCVGCRRSDVGPDRGRIEHSLRTSIGEDDWKTLTDVLASLRESVSGA